MGFGSLISIQMKTPEELKAMTPEELLAYTQGLQAESAKKDNALAGLTDQLANQKAIGVQKLKVGKKTFEMKYGAIRQDGKVYSFEALQKLSQEEVEAIIENDEGGSFELIK